MENFYQEDLAYVHHAGFGDFARRAGEQILALLRARQIDSGLIVDLGCGSGIWAELLLRSGYGLKDLPGDEQLQLLFQRIGEQLPAGGPLIFDVIVASQCAGMDYRTWLAGDDWAVLIDCSEQKKLEQLTRRITLFRRVGQHYRRSEELHQVRVFNPDALVRLLESAGFSVSVSDCYGNYQLAPLRLAFIATKKAGLSNL